MENILNKNLFIRRRRDLIPIWMKPFIFLFMIFGILAIYGIGKNILGQDSSSTLYGLESNTHFSLLGIFLTLIMLFKVMIAFGLWSEKDWAVKLGIIDAIFGIIICVVVMVVLPFVDFKDGINQLNIRFEIFLLIPYLIKLIKIRKEWENFTKNQPVVSNIIENEITKSIIEEKVIEIKIESNEIIDKEDPSRFMPK